MWTTSSSQARQGPAAFDHLHLVDPTGTRTIEFYQRLFDPAVTRRFMVGADHGLQTGVMRLLVSARQTGSPRTAAPDAPGTASRRSAIWHYGWGEVSLGESYLDHNLREVAWEPPLPPDAFHLHVESVSPNAAANWYGDHFGARVEMAAPFEEQVASADLRRPRAIAWLGRVALVFYRADGPLAPTRGQRVDHLAVQVADVDWVFARLVGAEAAELEPPGVRDGIRSAMVEGPDRMAIELVQKGTK